MLIGVEQYKRELKIKEGKNWNWQKPETNMKNSLRRNKFHARLLTKQESAQNCQRGLRMDDFDLLYVHWWFKKQVFKKLNIFEMFDYQILRF